MRYYVSLPSREQLAVDVIRKPDGSAAVEMDGRALDVDVAEADGAVSIRVGNRMVDLWLEGDGSQVHFVGAGNRSSAVVESERARQEASSRPLDVGGSQVSAPMPGQVVKVLVQEGDEIAAGQPVIVVEAMKMENELCAERAGKVVEICAQPGQHVDGGVPLVRLS